MIFFVLSMKGGTAPVMPFFVKYGRREFGGCIKKKGLSVPQLCGKFDIHFILVYN